MSDVYHSIKENQQVAFNGMLAENRAAIDKMTADVNSCVKKCKSASEIAENSLKELCRITRWEDLLYYLCPLLVLVDVVLRLYQMFT